MSRYNVNNEVIKITLIVFASLFFIVFFFTLIKIVFWGKVMAFEDYLNLLLTPVASMMFFLFSLSSISIKGDTLIIRRVFSKIEIVSDNIDNYTFIGQLGLYGFLFLINLKSGKNLKLFVTSASCKAFFKDWLDNAVLPSNASEVRKT